jgi:hypothetical protein
VSPRYEHDRRAARIGPPPGLTQQKRPLIRAFPSVADDVEVECLHWLADPLFVAWLHQSGLVDAKEVAHA